MSLINLKSGLLLFCVIILLKPFCLFPVKYISRAAAIFLEQKTCSLPCFCSCSLYNIETVRTSQRYSSVTVFSLYMLIDLSIRTYIYTHTSMYIYTHTCSALTLEMGGFLPQTPQRPSGALRGMLPNSCTRKPAVSKQREGRSQKQLVTSFFSTTASFFFVTANCAQEVGFPPEKLATATS